ncbi:MAG: hypothetical protein ACTHM6_11930 [Tepidisphaeraceae bacterium]
MRHVPIESVKRDRRLTMTLRLTTTMLAMTLAAVVAAGAGPATQPADARAGDGLAARVARLEAIVLHAPADSTGHSTGDQSIETSSANASAPSSVELRLEALERKLSDRSASDRLGGDGSGNDQASIANLQAAVSRLDEKEQAISRQVAALQGKGVGTPIGRAEPTVDQLRRDVDQMQRDLQDLRARVRQVEERQDRR